MNKTKMILAVLGGVIAVAVLVLAYLTWSAFSAKTAALEGDDEEGTDGLETVMAKAESLSGKSVYPCAQSVKEISADREAVLAWKDEAFKLASRGDRPVAETTDAAFKEFIVGDAKRLAALPLAAMAKIVKPDFDFGPFRPYIAEGRMPEKGELKKLQRQWDDVSFLLETLAACGVSEVTAVEVRAAAPASEETRATNRKDARKNVAKKSARPAAAEDASEKPVSFTYVLSFLTRPAAFVKTFNALATGERFAVVEDFSFLRPKDAIAEALGGEKKPAAESAPSRRRRRGAAAVAREAAKPAADETKGGIVTDPLLDEPFAAKVTVTIYDFRSMEEPAKEETKQ